MSSASGKFYAMMQQDGRPSEGADLLQVAGSALPRLGAGSWAHDAGRREPEPRISLAFGDRGRSWTIRSRR